MDNKWDEFIVKDTVPLNKWEQYAVTEKPIEKTASMGIGAQLGQSFENTAKSIFKGIVNPPYRISAHALQGLESIIRGGKATTYRNPLTGDIVNPYTKETKLSEPIGLGLQGASAMVGGPTLGGAMYGGGQALEEKGNIGQILKNALFGGTIGKTFGLVSGEPLITGQAGQWLRKRLQKGAEKSYTKAIGPTTKSEKEIAKKIVPGLTERKPFVWTRQGLETAAEKQKAIAGETLENAYQALPKETKFKVLPVINNIRKKQSELTINGFLPDANKAEFNALEKLQWDYINTINKTNVSLDTIREYRQLLDKTIEATKYGFKMTGRGGPRLQAQRYVANSIRRELAKQQPSIAKLNSEFSFWKNMTDVLETTVPKEKTVLSHLGTTIGQVSGQPFYGIFMRDLGRLFSDNVAWNSFAGSQKARMSDLLSRGDFQGARSIILKALKK